MQLKILKFNTEKLVLFLLCLSFFIGIWHAFPMLNVVGDEMYYVGGVLRAMEHHSIIPFTDDVPYGTLTYLLNYVMSTLSISLLLPFFGFSIINLKLFLIQSPSIMYLSLRLLSALLSVVMLLFLNDLLKKELEDQKTRLFLLILLFSNTIISVILHTGKMWVLSILLVIISFYYLYKTVCVERAYDREVLHKNMFFSITFSFLALSNFPLNVYSLINLPILLFYFKSDKILLGKIMKYTAIGLLIFLLITLFNFESIKNQVVSIFVSYHPIVGDTPSNLNFIDSFYTYFIKFLLLFPLLIITLLLSVKDKIKNKNLLLISSIYFLTYFLSIVIVANWTSDIKSYLRYLFPLGFFLILIISSFDLKFKKAFYFVGSFSAIFYLFTLYYLCVPTTYNETYDWVNKNLSSEDVIIINEVSELQLIKNKESSVFTENNFCVSKCHNIINFNLNSDFRPLVIDLISKKFEVPLKGKDVYYIKDNWIDNSSLKFIKSFENYGSVYHSVDYNMGNYFDPNYFRIKNLGKNIYIYRDIN